VTDPGGVVAREWRGWRRGGFPEDSWAADGDDGVRTVAGAPRVDLASRRRWGDAMLELEWRVAPGGNSGILYRASETAEESWQSGPELQLLDDEGHPDGRVAETRAGALYGLVAPDGIAACEGGRWHSARVLLRGSTVEHWIDGVRVVAADLEDPALRARIAAGKFGAFPGFGREREGHLVLQHHGDAAWFRRIRITPL
jgi:hypothetical protein